MEKSPEKSGGRQLAKVLSAAAVLCGIAGVAGALTLPEPLPIDESRTLAPMLPCFGIFLAFAASVLGWGWLTGVPLIRHARGRTEALVGAAAAGTVAYSAAMGVAGAVSLLGSRYAWMARAACAVGVALLAVLPHLSGFQPGPPRPSVEDPGERTRLARFVERFAIVGAWLAIVIHLLQGFKVQQHGDPLYYDLAGPRLWFNAGAIRFFPTWDIMFQCKTWDLLNLWPLQLFGREGGVGLAEGQFFAQWIIALFGAGGSALAIWALLRKVGSGRLWAAVGAFAALSSAVMHIGAHLAKNDWGVGFWVIAGVLIALNERRRSSLLWAGVLIGAAFMGKFLTAATIAPGMLMVAAFWIAERASPGEALRRLGWLTVGFALAAGPVMFRDWYYTGAPMYPVSIPGFPNRWLSPTIQEYFDSFHSQGLRIQLGFLPTRLWELLWDAPVNWIWALAPLGLAWVWRRRSPGTPRMAALWLMSAGSFLGYQLIASPASELRWLGPGLVLIPAVGVAAMGPALPRSPFFALGIVALLLGSGRFPLHTFLQVTPGRLSVPASSVLDHKAGPAKAWLRAHARPEDLVVCLSENEVYYLLGLNVRISDYDADFDRRLRAIPDKPTPEDLRTMLALFKEKGARYVMDPGVQPHTEKLHLLASTSPESIAFRSGTSWVVDVSKIVGPDLGSTPLRSGD